MDVDPASIPLFPTYDVAPIGSPRFNGSVERDLEELSPTLVHIDPLYAYHPPEAKGSSLYEEGAMLTGVSSMCVDAGTSLLINTHFNRTSNTGLRRITMAGGAEWSDSWILVTHRQDPDVDNGRFWLLLEVGSRQWGGTKWDLDLDVGKFDPDLGEFDGDITWNINPAQAPTKAEAKDKTSATESAIVETLTDKAWDLTKTDVRAYVKGDRETFNRAWDRLEADRVIGSVQKHREEGGKLRPRDFWGVVKEPGWC